MGARNHTVSIIIPAYNVEAYIERCVQSLLEQTHKNIEIIIIDDGSTDNTGEVCRKLCKKDDRIVYVCKKNGGQGAARNLGIRISKGEYITFADSDDWCAPEYVEEMYQSMIHYDTDICVCGKYGVDLDEHGAIVRQRVIEQWMDPEKRLLIADNRDLIFQIKYSLWAKMFKRELFIEKDIWQPHHKFENNTVIPMLVSQATALSMVSKPLYYYWMNRAASTINNAKSYLDMIKCLQEVETYFKEKGLWNTYYTSLRGFAEWNVNHTINRLHQFRTKIGNDVYEAVSEELSQYIEKTYPETSVWRSKKISIWGSYNLRKTVMNIVPSFQIDKMYGFSNIISVTSEGNADVPRMQHVNPYREKMIAQDCSKNFARDENALECTDVLFIDLLEERYGTCRYKDVLYTRSEALSEVLETSTVEMLENDERYIELWKESCLRFIERVKRKMKPKQVVLVKYYLAEYHGEIEKNTLYSESQKISEINAWLEQCYKFFAENFKGIQVVETKDSEFLFTDENFEYGCYPYHLNSMCYEETAKKIKLMLEDKENVL